MAVRERSAAALILGLILILSPGVGSGELSYFDDFPYALSNFVTGGWQGPFGDGTGGTIAVTSDGMGVLLDGTVNALAYAIRTSPQMTDVNLTVVFAIQNRDMTVSDQFSLLLAWRNSTYPSQSSCPPCLSPTPQTGIVVNFNIGRGTVRVSEVTNSVATEVAVGPSGLTAGPEYEARVEYANGNLSVYLGSMRELVVAGLQKPAGPVGFMTYRMDVAVDSLRFEFPQPTSQVPENPSIPPQILEPTAWLIALVAGVAGGGTVAIASMIVEWARQARRPK